MRTDAVHSETGHTGHHGIKHAEIVNVLAGIKEADPETLPPYMKHPPSPPVRLRSRYEICKRNSSLYTIFAACSSLGLNKNGEGSL